MTILFPIESPSPEKGWLRRIRDAALPTKKPKQMSADSWVPYEGPKGGKGWQNTSGDVVYKDKKPGHEWKKYASGGVDVPPEEPAIKPPVLPTRKPIDIGLHEASDGDYTKQKVGQFESISAWVDRLVEEAQVRGLPVPQSAFQPAPDNAKVLASMYPGIVTHEQYGPFGKMYVDVSGFGSDIKDQIFKEMRQRGLSGRPNNEEKWVVLSSPAKATSLHKLLRKYTKPVMHKKLIAESLARHLRVQSEPLLSKVGESPAPVDIQIAKGAEIERETLAQFGVDRVEDIAGLGGLSNDTCIVKVQYRKFKRAATGESGYNVMISTADGFESDRILGMSESGEPYIRNSTIEVYEKNRGTGTMLFARQVREAQRLGVTEIGCHAARSFHKGGYNGYWTWARLGYDGDVPWRDMKSRYQGWQDNEHIREATPEILAAEQVSDLMKTAEGREWWKKYGVSTDMVFDLREGSYSMTVLREYLAERGLL